MAESDNSWDSNIVNQNDLYPFHLIVSNSATADNSSIADKDTLEDSGLWLPEFPSVIKRRGSELAKALKNPLLFSERILFVDPHIGFENRRYTKSFSKLLPTIFKDRIWGGEKVEIELHTSSKSEAIFFKSQYKSFIEQCKPELGNCKITFFQWRDLPDGDGLHPKYLLTNLIGIRAEAGFDEGRATQATTDINTIKAEQYSIRWDQFSNKNGSH